MAPVLTPPRALHRRLRVLREGAGAAALGGGASLPPPGAATRKFIVFVAAPLLRRPSGFGPNGPLPPFRAAHAIKKAHDANLVCKILPYI